MKTCIFTGIVLLYSVLGMCQSPTAAEKLAGKLPDGTFAFIATSGMEQIRPAFNESSLGQLCNDPNMRAFYTQIKSALLNKLEAEMSGSPEDKQTVTTVSRLMEEVIECPIILGAGEASADPNRMPFRLFVVLDAGKHKDAMTPLINDLEKMIDKEQVVEKQLGNFTFHCLKETDEMPVVWGWCQNYFVILVNDEKGKTIDALRSTVTKPTPLARVKGYGDALAVYYDVQKVIAIASRMADKEGGAEEMATAKKVLKDLGIDTVKSATMRMGFDRRDMVAEKWLEVPAPQTGIFTALKPVDITMADNIDKHATTVVMLNIDWTVLYDVVWGAIKNAAPEKERNEIQASITEFETTNHFQIRNGLLKSMDGRIAGYSCPPGVLPEASMGGTVLIAGIKDAALFTQTMEALGTAASKEAEPQQLQISTQPLENGKTLHIWLSPQLAMTQIIPNWIIVDNQLVLTTNPALTQAVIKQMGAANAKTLSIRTVPAFQSKLTNLPSGVFYLQYSDTAANLTQLMKQAQQFWPMLVGLAAGQGITLPMMTPNVQDKLERLGQSWQYGWMDETGLHGRYQGSGTEMSAGTVAGAAMGLAILMPALNKTKMVSRRVISGTNLKGIGTACQVYANDHADQFPPTLETLIKECDLSEKILVSPRKPDSFSGPSYIYITGQKTSNSPRNILVYEQPAFAKDGVINVLFIDGHVETMNKTDFEKQRDETYKNLGRIVPDESDPMNIPVRKKLSDPNRKPEK